MLTAVSNPRTDFGLIETKSTDSDVWLRGHGSDQYVYHLRRGPRQFLGGAFEVESKDDLEKALQLSDVHVLSNGIEEMVKAPGGGSIVTLADPEGFPISLVHGQAPGQPLEPSASMPDVVINKALDKPRQRHFNRFTAGPAPVYKVCPIFNHPRLIFFAPHTSS
jgi:hypothetical protein